MSFGHLMLNLEYYRFLTTQQAQPQSQYLGYKSDLCLTTDP
jgi:hypothetical protein